MRIPRPGVIPALARALDVTQGQASTLVIGLGIGLGSAVVAMPAALEDAPPRQQALAQTPQPDQPPQPGGTDRPQPADTPTAIPTAGSPATDDTAPTEPDPSPPVSSPTDFEAPSTTTGDEQQPSPAPEPEPTPTPAPTGSVSRFVAVAGQPTGLAVADDGRTYLAITPDDGEQADVAVVSPDGRVQALHPVEVDPAGAGLADLTLHDDTVAVARTAPPGVVWLDPDTGEATRTRDIPDLPPCVLPLLAGTCEPGPVDNAPRPTGLAVGADGELYVTDAAQATVWRLTPDDHDVEAWLQREEFVSDAGPAGIHADDEGNLVLAVTRSVTAATGGAIYRVPVTDDGAAGEPEQLATTEPETDPMGIALARSDRIYITLQGAGQLLVLTPDGEETDRHLDEDDDPGLAAPFGLAFTDTTVLVSGTDPERDDRGLLLRVEVGEPGLGASRP